MKNISSIFLLIFTQFTLAQNVKVDFGKIKDSKRWNIINDGVMGGLSEGKTWTTDDSVTFQGTVSLENNGGFSSYRSAYTKLIYPKTKKLS